MKSLAEIACEAWWMKLVGLTQPRAHWGRLDPVHAEAWEASAEAVSQAIFERLGEVLDEGDEEPEVKETA